MIEVQKEKGETLKQFAYRSLRKNIMSLTLTPGHPLSEVELCQYYSLSRTPIREVLAKLKEEHLIDVYPQIGTYVSKINLTLTEEAAFMRSTLEREVLKEACKSFQSKDLLLLKQNMLAQEYLATDTDNYYDFHQLDSEFHRIIFTGVQKERIWDSILKISTHYNRIRLLSEMVTSYDTAIAEHKKIIRIIEEKKVDEVDDIIYQHIMKPTEQWAQFLDEEHEYSHYFIK